MLGTHSPGDDPRLHVIGSIFISCNSLCGIHRVQKEAYDLLQRYVEDAVSSAALQSLKNTWKSKMGEERYGVFLFSPSHYIHPVLLISETFQSHVNMFCNLSRQKGCKACMYACVYLPTCKEGNAKTSFESLGCPAHALESQYCLQSL